MNYTPRQIEIVARICHEARRAYLLSLDDYSLPHWEDAPDWHKVPLIGDIIFYLEHAELGPSHIHHCWVWNKKLEGYTYGPYKCDYERTHPDLMPYQDLPERRLMMDKITYQITKTFFI